MTQDELHHAAQALRHRAAACNNSDIRTAYEHYAQAYEFAAGTGSPYLASTIRNVVLAYDRYLAECAFTEQEAAEVNAHGAATLDRAEAKT